MCINGLIEHLQNSKACNFVSDSLFFANIDNIAFLFLSLTIVLTAFAPSGAIGLSAVLFSLICILKLLFKKGEKVEIAFINKILIVYFLFVIISLAGSSLFVLSLKGILKTFIYLLFYFSAAYYLSSNKKKIFPVILLILSVCSFEAVIGIVQNLTHIDQIATWQDSSNLKDSSHLISRAYGTLVPYNPNLLAGYLVSGLSSVFMFLLYFFFKKNKPAAVFFLFLFLTICYAIFVTGSRGAYLGLFGFFGVIIAYIFILFKKYRIHCAVITGAITAGIFLIPSFCARIISIFSMRGDSSISFRLNVYQASFKMFLDNIFLGIGVGNSNFREIYGLYMKTGFDALGAYSVPLEIAVESGIFALLSFIFYILLVVIRCIKYTLNASVPAANRIIIFSVLLTVCAVMFHGFFDTVFFRPQIQIIFWINMAIFYALTLKR